MPLYDIYCDCGYKQEIILKLTQEIPLCPKCGQKMKKAVSSVPFILKGRGWAKDGYSKDKPRK